MGSRHLRHFIPQKLRDGFSALTPLAPGGQVELYLRPGCHKSRVRSRCCYRCHNLAQRLTPKLKRRHSGLLNNRENRRPNAKRATTAEPSSRSVLPVSGAAFPSLPPPGTSAGGVSMVVSFKVTAPPTPPPPIANSRPSTVEPPSSVIVV